MLLWKILVLAFIASETLEKPRDSNKSGCISNSHIWNVEKRQKMDMLRFDISSYKAFRGTWDIQHTTNEFQDAIFGMLVLLRYMSADIISDTERRARIKFIGWLLAPQPTSNYHRIHRPSNIEVFLGVIFQKNTYTKVQPLGICAVWVLFESNRCTWKTFCVSSFAC